MEDTIDPVISLKGSNLMVGDRVIVSDVSPNIMATRSSLYGSGLVLSFKPSMQESSQIIPFGQFSDCVYLGNSILSSNYYDDSSGHVFVDLMVLDSHLSFQQGHEGSYVNICVDSTMMEARGLCQGMLYMEVMCSGSRYVGNSSKVLSQVMKLKFSGQWKPFCDQLMDQLVEHGNKASQFLDEVLPSNNFTVAAGHDEAHLEFNYGTHKNLFLIGDTNKYMEIYRNKLLKSTWFNREEDYLESSWFNRKNNYLQRLQNFRQKEKMGDTIDPAITFNGSSFMVGNRVIATDVSPNIISARSSLGLGDMLNNIINKAKPPSRINLSALYHPAAGVSIAEFFDSSLNLGNIESPLPHSTAVPQLLAPVDTCLVDIPSCGYTQEDDTQEPTQMNKATWPICLQQMIRMMKHAGRKVDSQIGTMIIATFVAKTTANCEAAIHSGSPISWLDYVMTGISGLICVLMMSSWMIKPTRYEISSSANPIKDNREELSHFMAGSSVTIASMGIFFYIFSSLPPVYAVTAICTCMTFVFFALFYGSASGRVAF